MIPPQPPFCASCGGCKMENIFLAAALHYAAMGFAVLPLRPERKEPLIEGASSNASRDPAVIKAWWAQWPNANVGIACGARHNLIVLDLEGPDRVPQGFAFMRDIIAQNKKLGGMPPAPLVRTRAGGYHLYLSPKGAPAEFHKKLWARLGGRKWEDPNNPKLSMGDLQFDGKHVVAPPSFINGIHYEKGDGRPGGITGTYAWERHLLGSSLPPAPRWFWKVVEQVPIPKRPASMGAAKYPEKIQYLVDEVRNHRVGSHNRNGIVYWASRRAVEEVIEGHYSAHDAINALWSVALEIGLGDDDPKELPGVLRHLTSLTGGT